MAGKLTRWTPDPAGEFTHPVVATSAAAVDAAPCTDAVTETFWEILFAVSEAVTVMVTLPEGAVLAAETVRTAEPDPPVIEVVSRLAVTLEFAAEALSVTVPVKPFTACTLIVYVPAAPAEMDCDVGLADNENSELLPPPLPEPLTVRRGEITQPFAMKSRAANRSANLRMNPLFPPTLRDDSLSSREILLLRILPGIRGASKQKDNLIGFPGAAQMFAGWRQEMVKSRGIFVKPV